MIKIWGNQRGYNNYVKNYIAKNNLSIIYKKNLLESKRRGKI